MDIVLAEHCESSRIFAIGMPMLSEIIKDYGYDPSEFLFIVDEKKEEEKAYLIDLLEREVNEISPDRIGQSNFEGDIGRKVNISNECSDTSKFFYDRSYEVAESAWDYLIIKVRPNVFIKAERSTIYEWDDLK